MRLLVALLFVVFVTAFVGRPAALFRAVPLTVVCVAVTVVYLSLRAY